MNRTAIFLGAAAVLALVALVAGLPRAGGSPSATVAVPTTPTIEPPSPATASNGSLSLTTRLSHPLVAVGATDVFVTADVRGVEVPGRTRGPVNLALVIDRSGSMSGFKLEQARHAARHLVGALRADDRLSIVHYGSDVKALEGLLATPEGKARMLAYIDGIWDDGGTNISAALVTAREMLERTRGSYEVNRVILISDGQPTEGITDPESLVNVARTLRASGLSLSSIGVGDDFNEQLMESLAEVGAGAYAYLQDASQLERIFQKDLDAAGMQVARAVTMTLKVPTGSLVRTYGYSPIARTQQGTEELITLALPDIAAGGSERVVLQLSIRGAAAGQTLEVGAVSLHYTDLLASQPVTTTARVHAQVTSDLAAIQEQQDGEALVFAARAQAGANTQAAVEALKRGDRLQARKLFEVNKSLLGSSGRAARAPSVANDLAEQDALIDGLEAAKDEGAVNSYSKAARKKARMDFGLFNSTY